MKYVVFALLGLTSLLVQAQSPFGARFMHCGADHMRTLLHQQQPQVRQQHQVLDQFWYRQQVSGQTSTTRQLYTIPTVVHIIHNNGPENISDAQVQAAVAALNNAMRNRAPFNPTTGVDVEIEFCLAAQDPGGNLTTGILRAVSPLTDFTMETQDLQVKALSRWDPNQYLNIYIVNSITSLSSGPGVAGYAYFPSSHGNPEDGIVGEAAFFDSSPNNISIYVHEAGHYLGLYHTFEGGCANNNCLTDGDRVCDTPPDASTNAVSCSASPNTCSTDEDDTDPRNPFRATALGGLGDQPDMINNYMDYGDPACYSIFTQGQKDRMVLALTGARASLLQSIGCQSTCLQPVTAGFTLGGLPVGVGGSIPLNSNTTGPVSSYDWTVNGQSFSQNPNANYTFTQAGTYIFSLNVIGTDPNCQDVYHDTLEVFCEPRASFTGLQSVIKLGDVMQLTANGAGSFIWLVDGVQVATGSQYSYSSNNTGSAVIQLVIDNGICKDTTDARIVKVGDCGTTSNNNHKMIWALEDSMLMDFNTSPPTISPGGKMHGTAGGNTPWLEGSISMCDDQGRLIFYSNGSDLWDRNHNIMPNSVGLLGQASSIYGSLVIPDPGNPDGYYLFTLDSYENDFREGLRYSKIDMTLNNGLGDIVAGQKNILIKLTYTELMSAVYHSNGTDIWLVTKRIQASGFPVATSDPEFLESYLITPAGVNLTPVVTPLTTTGGFWGAMKFSHDGTWLVEKTTSQPQLSVPPPPVLHRFNNQTGSFSQFVSLVSSTQFNNVFGVEFSEDDSRLYVSAFFGSIRQYDLSSGVAATIANSEVVITTNGKLWGKMELGPDNNIYIAERGGNFLHAILDPNVLGTACNLTLDYIAPTTSWNSAKRLNLPTYIRGQTGPSYALKTSTNMSVCEGDPIIVWPVTPSTEYDLEYEIVGNTDSTASNDTLYLSPTHTGRIMVVGHFEDACAIITDTLYFDVLEAPVIEFGFDDSVLCGGMFDFEAPLFTDADYLWSDGSTNRSNSFSSAGKYWLTITNTITGCFASDTIMLIEPVTIPSPDLGPDTLLCGGTVLILDPGNTYADIRWQDGSREPTHTAFLSGKYWVTVFDECGNTSSDTINIDFIPIEPIDLPDELFYCPEESVEFSLNPTGLINYQWDDGPTGTDRIFDQPGDYYLQAENLAGCVVRDTISVFPYPNPPAIPLAPVDSVCSGTELTIDASDPELRDYLWDDGISGAIRAVTRHGIYSVEASDLNGCLSKASISIVEIVPPPFDLPSEVRFCRPDTMRLDAETLGLLDIVWEDGNTNPVRSVFKTERITVSGLDKFGCQSSAVIHVYAENCPNPLFMPTAFSPNGDGHNETFGPVWDGDIIDIQLRIFNRWGIAIFEGGALQDTWDGTYQGQTCPEGVYAYTISFRGRDGRIVKSVGTVTLIR